MHFLAGRYDFTLIPVLLPTALLESLLGAISPTDGVEGWEFCEDAELSERGIKNEVGKTGDGLSWAVLHAGEHKKTGVQWLPGGSLGFHVSDLVALSLATSARAFAVQESQCTMEDTC